MTFDLFSIPVYSATQILNLWPFLTSFLHGLNVRAQFQCYSYLYLKIRPKMYLFISLFLNFNPYFLWPLSLNNFSQSCMICLLAKCVRVPCNCVVTDFSCQFLM